MLLLQYVSPVYHCFHAVHSDFTHHQTSSPQRNRASEPSFLSQLARNATCALIAVLLVVPIIYFASPTLYYRIYNKIAGTYRPMPNEQFDGIDLSHHNGPIDWAKLKGDKRIRYAYLKATEGYNHADSAYARNSACAKELGIMVGAYHVLTTKSPIALQFEWFASICKREDQDLIPMLDLEESVLAEWEYYQMTDSIQKFVTLAEEYYGVAPIIYSNYRFYQNYLEQNFPNHKFFIAKYGKQPPLAACAKQPPMLWQFTEHGSLPGIPKEVDFSRFINNMTLRDITLTDTIIPTPTNALQ